LWSLRLKDRGVRGGDGGGGVRERGAGFACRVVLRGRWLVRAHVGRGAPVRKPGLKLRGRLHAFLRGRARRGLSRDRRCPIAMRLRQQGC
jgi:hypothetical protein